MSTDNKTKKNLYPRTCKTCGAAFAGGPRAWYCPDCRAARKADAKKTYNARKRAGKVREIGSADICQKCGRTYVVMGGLQKYCENCAEEAMRELDRTQAMEYYNKNKSQINPKRNDTRRLKKTCARCGKEISAIGGRMFCEECKKEGRKEQYKAVNVSRNIYMCGKSYIVYATLDGKRVYVKCTTDKAEAFRLRDLADEKKRAGMLKEWLNEIKNQPGD